MDNAIYLHVGAEVAHKRRELAPKPLDAFKAAPSTVEGTPPSMAAWIVQRPSPQSETRPP